MIFLNVLFFGSLLLAVFSAGKDGAKETESNGEEDGSSFDSAIVIQETRTAFCVQAEYAWVNERYPGHKLTNQSLLTHNQKRYDVLSIITIDGKETAVFFDISNFYGKI